MVEELAAPPGPGSQWANLALGPHGPVLSWLHASDDGSAVLRASVLGAQGWSEPWELARGDDFFVNWADFPSVVPLADSLLLAHWLVRGPEGGVDYGIRIAGSSDGGRSWGAPWIPHEDGTHTEHGFVSIFPTGDGPGLVWLDGRDYAAAEARGEEEAGEMALRFRQASPLGARGEEVVLDARTCDCCQTDAALTESGPVVVFRDRSPDEVRDIAIVRRVDGHWTDPRPVHADGWVIRACPVNGPAVDASGHRVAVAWFTAADDDPRVLVAFSDDGGDSFGPPHRVDQGTPFGRVDVRLLPDGAAAVSWLERWEGEARVRLRRVSSPGEMGDPLTVAASAEGRAGGFPRMAHVGRGELLLAWTDPAEPRVRVARVRMPEADAEWDESP